MGVNNLNIIGNLGKDPERKGSGFNGNLVCKFSVGVSEKIKGEKKTTWFNCIAFGSTAEYILRTCQKGTQVFIDGPHRSELYNEKTYWTLFVNKLVALDKKKESDNGES